ncbi:MAG: Uncharacterised protein [SAR116 cluster bacterium]|nr:MAG: Uncharacterised protein [SAR116 cluster bacterium]
MAWQAVTSRKDHAPGQVCYAAVKLGIDEIRQPPKEKADRHDHGHPVADGENGNTATRRKQPHRKDHAGKTTMKGHAALPYLQNLQRVGQVITGLVEQHKSHTPPQDHAQQHMVQKAFNACHINRAGTLRLTP